MKSGVLFTTVIGTLILFLLGCGVDDINDGNDGSLKPETLGSITGKVRDENGNPVSGATVTTEPPTSQIITGADGRYEIPQVANGNYTVWARTSDREGAAPVAVKAGIAIADIRLTGEIVPTVTITDGPEGETTNSNVTFSWTGRNVTAYSYKLDDQAWSEWGKETTKAYNNLNPAPDGHTFSVKGRDDKGKESEIASRSFTIAEPPPISIEITFPKSDEKVELRTAMRTLTTLLATVIASVLIISCGDEGRINVNEIITGDEIIPGDTGQAVFTVQMAPQLADGTVKKVTVIVKTRKEGDELLQKDLKITGNSATAVIDVPAGNGRYFLVELRGENDTLIATGETTADVIAGQAAELKIKVTIPPVGAGEPNPGTVTVIVEWEDGLPPPPDGEKGDEGKDIAIEITDPLQNQKVEVRHTIKGEITGASTLQELLEKLKDQLQQGVN